MTDTISSPRASDRDSIAPFLLKLFYRTGAFHRPDEFSSPSALPPCLHIHTYESCTLLELTHHLAVTLPSALPSPAVGTRLSFRLIYRDPSTAPATSRSSIPPPRYLAKDLGSLVIGEGGPGAEAHTENAVPSHNHSVPPGPKSAAAKSLAESKFVVGDYISVAVLPPDADTGAVAPARSEFAPTELRRTSASVIGGVAPPPRRFEGGGFPAGPVRGRFGRGDGLRNRSPERDRRGGRIGNGGGLGVPYGEWRRGERVPEEGRRGGGGRRGPRW